MANGKSSRRALNEKKVAKLMKSMADIGLQHPITVRRVENVVDGQRRLEAALRLGWKSRAGLGEDNRLSLPVYGSFELALALFERMTREQKRRFAGEIVAGKLKRKA